MIVVFFFVFFLGGGFALVVFVRCIVSALRFAARCLFFFFCFCVGLLAHHSVFAMFAFLCCRSVFCSFLFLFLCLLPQFFLFVALCPRLAASALFFLFFFVFLCGVVVGSSFCLCDVCVLVLSLLFLQLLQSFLVRVRCQIGVVSVIFSKSLFGFFFSSVHLWVRACACVRV